jgi:hypothetical protein
MAWASSLHCAARGFQAAASAASPAGPASSLPQFGVLPVGLRLPGRALLVHPAVEQAPVLLRELHHPHQRPRRRDAGLLVTRGLHHVQRLARVEGKRHEKQQGADEAEQRELAAETQVVQCHGLPPL